MTLRAGGQTAHESSYGTQEVNHGRNSGLQATSMCYIGFGSDLTMAGTARGRLVYRYGPVTKSKLSYY